MTNTLKSVLLYLYHMQFGGFTSDNSLLPWTKYTYHTWYMNVWSLAKGLIYFVVLKWWNQIFFWKPSEMHLSVHNMGNTISWRSFLEHLNKMYKQIRCIQVYLQRDFKSICTAVFLWLTGFHFSKTNPGSSLQSIPNAIQLLTEVKFLCLEL